MRWQGQELQVEQQDALPGLAASLALLADLNLPPNRGDMHYEE